jgi:hypothetical protein
MDHILYINVNDSDLLEYMLPEYEAYKEEIQNAFKEAVLASLTSNGFFKNPNISWDWDDVPVNKEWESMSIISLGLGVKENIDLTDSDDFAILQAGHEGFLAMTEEMDKLMQDGCLKSEINEAKTSYENDLI